MSQIIIAILAFMVAISIIITVHEFGHFWVARRFGIKVLRFSIGFGRPLFRWYDKLGTEYVIAAIPLGGYVSIFGFGDKDQLIPPTERHMAFRYKPVWVRMSVISAGVFFNYLFAILVYWIIFMYGVSVFVPILGNVPKESIAGMAGLRVGEEIVAVEGKPTQSWDEVSAQLFSHLGEDKAIVVTVRENKNTHSENKTLDLGHWSDTASNPDWLDSLGFTQLDPAPAIVGKVSSDYPAFKAGMQEGDEILSADHQPIHSRSDFIHYVQARPNRVIALEVLRHHKKMHLTIEPMLKIAEDGKKNGFVGIEFPALKEIPTRFLRIERFGVVEALKMASVRTWEYSVLTLKVFKKMILGEVSLRHVSGPLGIAKSAGQSVSFGLKYFFEFLAVISIGVGILNTLPIPILDGGHFVYCLYEILVGRPASVFAQYVGAWVGGALLIGLMLLAFYNDISSILR